MTQAASAPQSSSNSIGCQKSCQKSSSQCPEGQRFWSDNRLAFLALAGRRTLSGYAANRTYVLDTRRPAVAKIGFQSKRCYDCGLVNSLNHNLAAYYSNISSKAQ